MNIGQLECFVSLASTLNFMQTAEELGLTQPAVSKQIKAMEEELGAVLFNRTSRSVSITPIGQHFVTQAQEMLKLYYNSRDWINTYHTHQRNILRIGYSDPNQMYLISKIMRLFADDVKRDNIIPQFVCDQTDANLSRLQKNQVDVVIGIKDAKFEDGGIIFKKLQDNGFKCVITKQHPLAESHRSARGTAGQITTEEMRPFRQILNIPPYLLKSFYSRGYRILPVNDQLDNILVTNANEAYSLALAGLGYTLIPDHLIIPHEDLLILDWKETPKAAFGIYYSRDLPKQSAVYQFVQSGVKYFKP
ncbi:MAG: LysR family transcriptional regulator [Eubacteriales bacterium]|nr:LysR family transcriptional regulator [Eubacteriales bacterium]